MKLKFKPKKKPVKNILFTPVRINTKQNIRKIKRKNLTWPQATIRYPKMKAFGDSDRDGKLNIFDCKPFDKKRHGKLFREEIAKKIYDKENILNKEKTYKFIKKGIRRNRSNDEEILRKHLKESNKGEIDLRTIKGKRKIENMIRRDYKMVTAEDIIKHVEKHPELLKQMEDIHVSRNVPKRVGHGGLVVGWTSRDGRRIGVGSYLPIKENVGRILEHELGHIEQIRENDRNDEGGYKGTGGSTDLPITEYKKLPAEVDANRRVSNHVEERNSWKEEKPETLQSLKDELKEDL